MTFIVSSVDRVGSANSWRHLAKDYENCQYIWRMYCPDWGKFHNDLFYPVRLPRFLSLFLMPQRTMGKGSDIQWAINGRVMRLLSVLVLFSLNWINWTEILVVILIFKKHFLYIMTITEDMNINLHTVLVFILRIVKILGTVILQ